jgi:hypothetical protein
MVAIILEISKNLLRVVVFSFVFLPLFFGPIIESKSDFAKLKEK